MESRQFNRDNYDYDFERDGEFNTLPSMTVPDQSLTIKDILYRFTQGLPLDDSRRPAVYGDDFEQSDDDWEVSPSNQFAEDLTDIQDARQYVEEVRERVQALTTTTNDDDTARDVPESPKDEKSE